MSYETLKFEINNGVGTITLNRPDAANAINIPMAKDLLKVAIECESGAPVRVLLLKGEGKLFCAGGGAGNSCYFIDTLPSKVRYFGS